MFRVNTIEVFNLDATRHGPMNANVATTLTVDFEPASSSVQFAGYSFKVADLKSIVAAFEARYRRSDK